MSDEKPSTAQTAPQSVPHEAHNPLPPPNNELQVEFRNDEAGQRVLVLKHPSFSGSGSCTVDATAGNSLVSCGDLRIQITNTVKVAEETATLLSKLTPPSAVPKLFGAPDSNANDGKASEHSGAAAQKSACTCAVCEAFGKQSGVHAKDWTRRQPGGDIVKVTVQDDTFRSTYFDCKRSTRVVEVIEAYAELHGLNAQRLKFTLGLMGRPISPQKRLGTFVDRKLNITQFKVENLDAVPDPHPYSDYDSDDDNSKA